MIQGNVTDFQARVDVTFRLQDLSEVVLEFVVDTGFEGALTLPAEIIERLGLPLVHEMTAQLADDSLVRTNIHAGTIIWGG